MLKAKMRCVDRKEDQQAKEFPVNTEYPYEAASYESVMLSSPEQEAGNSAMWRMQPKQLRWFWMPIKISVCDWPWVRAGERSPGGG